MVFISIYTTREFKLWHTGHQKYVVEDVPVCLNIGHCEFAFHHCTFFCNIINVSVIIFSFICRIFLQKSLAFCYFYACFDAQNMHLMRGSYVH